MENLAAFEFKPTEEESALIAALQKKRIGGRKRCPRTLRIEIGFISNESCSKWENTILSPQ